MTGEDVTFIGDDPPSTGDVADRGRNEFACAQDDCNFRILCERSLAGIYIVQDDCIKYANAAVAEMLTCEPEKLIGRSPLAFVHPDDRADVEEHMRSRQSGEDETSRYEARCVRGDGSTAYVEVLGSRIVYEGRPALMGTLVDITSRKLRRVRHG